MLKIPENPNKRDFEGEVDCACREVLNDFAAGRDYSEVGCNEALYHSDPAFNVDVCMEMARRFKMKGYHARWHVNMKGRRCGMIVATYASNNDI